MPTGNLSVVQFASRRQPRAGVKIFRASLAAAIAFAPVTVALAQSSQPASQPRQTEGQRQATPGRLTVPITGMVGLAPSSSVAPGVQAVVAAPPQLTGSFTIQRFARTTENAVAAVGTLTASFVDPGSNATRTFVTQIAMAIMKAGATSAELPVAAAIQSCESLGVVLSAIDIRLLSLPVHLDTAMIDLTVVPGTGERFGTLLCTAGAQFDDLSKPAELVDTLNALLDLIG
jgi:hypothetical protein